MSVDIDFVEPFDGISATLVNGYMRFCWTVRSEDIVRIFDQCRKRPDEAVAHAYGDQPYTGRTLLERYIDTERWSHTTEGEVHAAFLSYWQPDGRGGFTRR